MNPLFVLAISLVFFGLAGVVTRRSLLVVTASFFVAFLGIATLFIAFAHQRGDAAGYALGIIVLLVALSHVIVCASLIIAVFRRRATVNIDELRELRG